MGSGNLLDQAVRPEQTQESRDGRGLATLGVGAPKQSGRVERVNASDGGVPKLAVDRTLKGDAAR